jgi:hypothetical protein
VAHDLPFELIAVEMHADACLDLVAASFLHNRFPSLAEKFIGLAVQALALRAQWLGARAADT